MHSQRILLLATFGGLALSAQSLTTMRVSSEVAPVGGMAQMKLLMTSPKPIITGLTAFDLTDVSFDSIDGINLFSPTGDVAGAAVINGTMRLFRRRLRFFSHRTADVEDVVRSAGLNRRFHRQQLFWQIAVFERI